MIWYRLLSEVLTFILANISFGSKWEVVSKKIVSLFSPNTVIIRLPL